MDNFDKLYGELVSCSSHPFDWMHGLLKPKWWQFHLKKRHYIVKEIFEQNGLILTEADAHKFFTAEGQMPLEDTGGAIIRQLTEVWDNK